MALFGISAKSDAEREPGFRQNHCGSGKIVLATFRAGLALKGARTISAVFRVRALHPILLKFQKGSLLSYPGSLGGISWLLRSTAFKNA